MLVGKVSGVFRSWKGVGFGVWASAISGNGAGLYMGDLYSFTCCVCVCVLGRVQIIQMPTYGRGGIVQVEAEWGSFFF